MLSFDTVWGIERNENSDFFDKLAVPTIALWDRPGGAFSGGDGFELTGALAHGEQVFITGAAVVNGFNWSKVEADIWHDDENFHQEGWVRDSLLKNKGAIEYGND